jgi:hypothetical protein
MENPGANLMERLRKVERGLEEFRGVPNPACVGDFMDHASR